MMRDARGETWYLVDEKGSRRRVRDETTITELERRAAGDVAERGGKTRA